MTRTRWGQAAGGTFSHQAVLYDGPGQYARAVKPFVRDGLAGSEPVLVAVPAAAAAVLRAGLDGESAGVALDGESVGVAYADMTELGRNPARIIAAIWDFIGRHPGRAVRFVGEPFWPGRPAAEAREAVRHEALINLAFSSVPVAILCPYDVSQLASPVIASAGRTHPVIRTPAGQRPSADYCGGRVPRAAARPLSPPPARAERLTYSADLRPVRDFVTRHAERSGLGRDRGADLVLAVSELAANTLRHTSGGGTVHAWRTRGETICQVSDGGRIADPLVGRKRPPDANGLGLWVVHQVCDLVELRTGRTGTVVRMRMLLEAAPGGVVLGSRRRAR